MPFWSCRYAINVAIYVASAVHFNHTKTVSVSLANNYNLFMFALGSHLGRDKTLEKITLDQISCSQKTAFTVLELHAFCI